MNVEATNVLAPVPPRNMAETGLSTVMMRDILLKTMFRMNLSHVSEIAQVVCLPLSAATSVDWPSNVSVRFPDS